MGFSDLCGHGGMGVSYKVPLFKISKTKKDLALKLFSQKYICVVYIACLFLCLVCIIWYDCDVISMIALCKLDKVLVYQQSFGTVYIFEIYVFLVSHCYTWNKKTVKNQ